MNAWEVYWAAFPYEDNPAQEKIRPVVIAKDNGIYVLTLKITTHDPRDDDEYDCELTYWREANLPYPSVVRLRKLAQLKPTAVQDYVGKLHPADIIDIQIKMKQYRESMRPPTSQ